MIQITIDEIVFNRPTTRIFARYVAQEQKLAKYMNELGDSADEIKIVDAQYAMCELLLLSCLTDDTQKDKLIDLCENRIGWIYSTRDQILNTIVEQVEEQKDTIEDSLKSSASTGETL